MEAKRLSKRMILCLIVLICTVFLTATNPTTAQNEQINLEIRTLVAQDSYNALKEEPVMVSVIKNGELIRQTEARLNSGVRFSLPAGVYDLRFEGSGMSTLVKRGILIKTGEKTDIIGGPMRSGKGVKTIEYATGGLSREEIAARLNRLEEAVTELQKKLQGK